MNHKNILVLFIFAFISLTFMSCNPDESSNKDDDLNTRLKALNEGALVKVSDKLFSIPSPIQVAMMVKDSELNYNKNYLNSTDNIKSYTSNFKKAINFGIFGANLAYLQIYEQYPDATLYFAAVKKLGEELGVSSYFNEQTLERIEANNSNRDSLITILSEMYRDLDTYFFDNEQNVVGVLILAGGWVETLHLLISTLKEKSNQDILNRIGEQKYPLDNLIALLRPFYGTHSDDVDNLIQGLINLAIIYDGVDMKYSYIEPTVHPEQKLTQVNSISKTIISDYQLNAITDTVSAIRKSLIE